MLNLISASCKIELVGPVWIKMILPCNFRVNQYL
jgi:hypothetical protein